MNAHCSTVVKWDSREKGKKGGGKREKEKELFSGGIYFSSFGRILNILLFCTAANLVIGLRNDLMLHMRLYICTVSYKIKCSQFPPSAAECGCNRIALPLGLKTSRHFCKARGIDFPCALFTKSGVRMISVKLYFVKTLIDCIAL